MTTEAEGPGGVVPVAPGAALAATSVSAEDPATPSTDARGRQGLMKRPVLVAGIVVLVLVLALAGVFWWLHERHFESTDDAFIDAHIVRLAPQIAGRVTAVLVADNQLLHQGQAVVVLDSAEVEARQAAARALRAQADAQLASARAQVEVNEATYQGSRDDAAVAAAQETIAALDLARFRELATLNAAAVAQQQLDQAEATARQSAAQHRAALRASQMRAAQLVASRTLVASAAQQVRATQAQLEEAGISLGYTRLDAPAGGHVAQKSVAVGDYLQPGTQILAIVPLEVWVTANFKETQLEYMRIGQAVSVKVDACPGLHVQGHVDSIQRGAGQAFAILPPENATGNFVKVVQRVPVKIVLDDLPADCPVGPGMSVEPTVTVR
jgi:membrane fusion protein (multidrug efflux system)